MIWTVSFSDSVQVKTNKRYAANEGYTVSEVAAKVKADIGNVDVVVGGREYMLQVAVFIVCVMYTC